MPNLEGKGSPKKTISGLTAPPQLITSQLYIRIIFMNSVSK